MSQLTVFIPGIMGSSLAQSSPTGATTQLWDENGFSSLSQLAGQPALLQYASPAPGSSGPAVSAGGVMHRIQFTRVFGRDLCVLLHKEMEALEKAKVFEYAEFAYDWRQDIFDAAEQLGAWLAAKHGFSDDAAGKQKPGGPREINIITHSMGSLVAAIALMEGRVHPGNVRRLISVGAPFAGAPASFAALYSTGYLPFMEWVDMWVNKGKDPKDRRKAIRDAVQSFVSSYQLLPHQADAFVKVRGAGWQHPFSSNIIQYEMQTAAKKAHKLMDDFEDFLKKNSVNYHFIYSASPKRFWFDSGDTPLRYKTRYVPSGPVSTFGGISPEQSASGDGTVPAESAALYKRSDLITRTGIPGVRHAYMCNDRTVVDRIKQLLV
jgi:pimeloyl-ACP methyl ester carboxylesterase